VNREYVAVFEPDDGGWTASVPDLPGCFSDSDTLVGAQAAIRDAIILWLETADKNGWSVPEPRSSAKLIAV
jgi:predicted RNase H-like HicB family nuclease